MTIIKLLIYFSLQKQNNIFPLFTCIFLFKWLKLSSKTKCEIKNLSPMSMEAIITISWEEDMVYVLKTNNYYWNPYRVYTFFFQLVVLCKQLMKYRNCYTLLPKYLFIDIFLYLRSFYLFQVDGYIKQYQCFFLNPRFLTAIKKETVKLMFFKCLHGRTN